MTIKSKDIKILWGRSGNRCAICKTQLTHDTAVVSAVFTLGEQAHIVGEKADAPRGRSQLTSEERGSYHNLILLCPNHHTEIDKNETDWPVERLYLVKSKHELWVTETLSETIDHVKLAQQASLGVIIDAAVTHCDLENWLGWTSFALSPDQRWPKERPGAIRDFRLQVIATIWPTGYEELKRSTITFSILLHHAAQTFMEHVEQSNDFYFADRYYKRPTSNPNYNKQLKEFEEWQSHCYRFLENATRAANWFADVVRRDINPMFFATKGKFLIMEPLWDMSFQTSLLEFTDEEKAKLPQALDGLA